MRHRRVASVVGIGPTGALQPYRCHQRQCVLLPYTGDSSQTAQRSDMTAQASWSLVNSSYVLWPLGKVLSSGGQRTFARLA